MLNSTFDSYLAMRGIWHHTGTELCCLITAILACEQLAQDSYVIVDRPKVEHATASHRNSNVLTLHYHAVTCYRYSKCHILV